MKDNDEINDNLRYATLRNESIYDGFANASNAAAHRSIFSITPSKSTLATAPIVSIALVASLAILAHVPDACASIAREIPRGVLRARGARDGRARVGDVREDGERRDERDGDDRGGGEGGF